MTKKKTRKGKRASKQARGAKSSKPAKARSKPAVPLQRGTRPPIPPTSRTRKPGRRRAGLAPRGLPRTTPRIAQSVYDIDLDKNAANYRPLTPLNFLERAA